MSEPADPTRRRLLGLLLSTGLAGILSVPGGQPGLGAPRDQGIGGTGVAPPLDDSEGNGDRGIGGTGVIGTIKKFGSIYVNDLRIAYPEDAEVTIDGRRAALTDLKLGQVVRVTTTGKDDALSTQRIAITHEVVGPVQSRGPNQLMVLGQTVSTEDLPGRTYAIGDTVAVSGLRRNDGTIVASLIEPRPGAAPRVSGPVQRLKGGGGLHVGALAVDRVSPSLVGKRATLEGQVRDGRFVVTRGISDASPFPKSVRRLSIESFVERRDGALALGSGYAIAGGGGLDFATGRSVRAIIATTVDERGRFNVESLRAGGRTYNVPGGGGGRRPGGGGGGRGPGGGGRGPGGGGRGPGGGGRGFGGHGPGGGRGFGGGRMGGEGRGFGEGPRGFGEGPRGFGPGGFGGPRGFGPGGPRGFGGPGGFRGGGFGGRGFGGGGFRGGGGFGGGGFRGGGGGFRGGGGGGFRGGGGRR